MRILVLLGLALSCAACGGGGGGDAAPVSTATPPAPAVAPAPLPTACIGADTFPGFLFSTKSTSTTEHELILVSSDGCRTESLGISSHRSATFHMTADRSQGVIVWNEDIDNQYIVRRLDFTVDSAGNLALGQPVTILPLVGEEAPPGDHLFYFSPDIWGDATHGSSYLTILRIYAIESGEEAGGGTTEALIYDLNELTGDLSGPAPSTRLIFHEQHAFNEVNYGTWFDAGDPAGLPDCSIVPFPQFVATCYRAEELRFNPSGTRLYVARHFDAQDGPNWYGTARIHIDRLDTMGTTRPLADWILTGPEMVYTSSGLDEPRGAVARPASDFSVLSSPELIAVTHSVGGNINAITEILNADRCAADLAPYSGGNSEAPFDLWQGCSDNTFFTGLSNGRGMFWQSPEALLKSSFQDPEYDIHRVYVSGELAGTEQLVIDADSGN